MITVFTDPRCLDHHVSAGYPEIPERLHGLLAHLRQRDWPLEETCSHGSAEEAVLRLHDETYVERFERAVSGGFEILDSPDNPVSPGSWSAAWGAVEAVLEAADRAVSKGESIFAAVRPPGHHAEQDLAMGFCYFNNIAVAADYLTQQHGMDRVAVFDFDVHHGNGTQHSFEARADIFYASTHQHPLFPGTGAAEERGRGAGEGFTLNVPLAAGTSDEAYWQVLVQQVLPALRSYRPQALLLSAGFDAWQEDPVGGMNLSAEIFRRLSRELAELAEEVCEGRLLSVLEGGYDLENLPRLVELHLEGLACPSHQCS